MADQNTPLHHLIKYKYQCFEGGTHVVATDVIDCEAILGRPAKEVMVITEATERVEMRFNTQVEWAAPRTQSATIDATESPDLANQKSGTITEANILAVEQNKELKFTLPVYDIQITGIVGNPKIIIY